MADPNGQTRLPNPTREDVLAAARTQAGRAAEQYAQLLAAEAGIAARAVFADVARLVFRLTEDVLGSSATLIAAYSAQGRRLWHIDTSEEWPDESLVTDYLAAAADRCPDFFEAIGADDVDRRAGAELSYLLEVQE